MQTKEKYLEDFNFKAFQEEAINRLKSGESLMGKVGILTPLIKRLLQASLD